VSKRPKQSTGAGTGGPAKKAEATSGDAADRQTTTKSPRQKFGPDWPRLLELAEAADQPLTPEELDLWKRGIIDGNARAWNVQYVHAASAALTQRRPAELLAMLRAEIPAPAFLLPVVAAVIEAQVDKPGGASPKLSPTTRKYIRDHYDHVLAWQSPALSEKMRRTKVVEYFAKVFGASTKTIERALGE
jgi:hypothetical protein